MAESTSVVVGKISYDPVTGKIGDSEVYKGKLRNPGSGFFDVAIKRVPKESTEQWKLTYDSKRPTNIVQCFPNEEDDNA